MESAGAGCKTGACALRGKILIGVSSSVANSAPFRQIWLFLNPIAGSYGNAGFFKMLNLLFFFPFFLQGNILQVARRSSQCDQWRRFVVSYLSISVGIFSQI